MKKIVLGLAVAAAFMATPAQASLVCNTAPAVGWQYGTGNNYSPANTCVLTTADGSQLYMRDHITFQVAPASDGSGVYSFAAGSSPISFDWGITNAAGTLNGIAGLISLVDVSTGQTASYDPFSFVNDNWTSGGSAQNSFRFNWLFTPNANDTLISTLQVFGLAGGTQSISTTAVLGSGAPPSGVPEPATWAMMLVGFGAIGVATRRRKRRKLSIA